MVADIQAQAENAALRRLDESIATSGVPEEMRCLGLTQGTRPKRYKENEQAIAALIDRFYPSLVIWGPRGRGKSHLATCWLMDRLRGGSAGIYCLEPLAIAQMWTYTRSHSGRDLYTEAMRTPFLVWDNLGSQSHMPPATRDLVVGVLMARHEARLTTVITCAADPAGGWVADQYGMDLASRLSSWQAVQIQGGDFRSLKLGEKQKA